MLYLIFGLVIVNVLLEASRPTDMLEFSDLTEAGLVSGWKSLAAPTPAVMSAARPANNLAQVLSAKIDAPSTLGKLSHHLTP